MIGYGKQSIDESDIASVVKVLTSDYLTQGPMVEQFEAALCEYTGAKYAVAVNSGTAALYAAYTALGLAAGKRLWTSPITFVATANAATLLGAAVEFVDVDPLTGNLCVKHLEARLEEADRCGDLPDIVVPVHLTGRSCDMAVIHALAVKYGFRIVEDASHALGGSFEMRKVGGCQYSDAVVFSFHPVKSITTGEGGAILTNSFELAEAAREIRHHGITRDRSKYVEQDSPGFHYEQQRLGFNFRLSDIQAALGFSQLKRLDSFIGVRKEVVARYYEWADSISKVDFPMPSSTSAWHLFAVRCHGEEYRNSLYAAYLAAGVITAVHYEPVYRHPWYKENRPNPTLPGAELYANSTLSLPVHLSIGVSDTDKIMDLLIQHHGRV